MTLTEIALLLNDDEDRITAIGKIIGKKVPKTDDFNALNEFEKNIIYVDILEHHVANGGFIQFFFNSSGQFAHEILEAYKAIKAEKMTSILHSAISLFPVIPVPKNQRLRQEILFEKPSNLDLWDALDDEFNKYEDDILTLTLNYVKENIAHFD